ncbi:MAG: DUF3459 domain-containing protein, partial [Synergistaceae bacterium]|nr:DUF3459 domain-containing protein [Synergistaceae bacterium]
LADDERLFAFVREYDGREVITVANFSLENVKLPDEIAGKKLILSSESKYDAVEIGALEARIY